MSGVEEAYVTHSELDALEKKVNDGFRDVRKNQSRIATQGVGSSQ